jgi:hypothetical protein
VIVTVSVVLPMDVTRDDVIDVAVVRNGNVLAADAVEMRRFMRVARMRLALGDNGDFTELVFEHRGAHGMVEMSVVHVVDVVVVAHGQMTAVLTVDVIVTIVGGSYHRYPHRIFACAEHRAHVP